MTKEAADKISLAEAREAILRSGYLLEGRVESVLTEHGFYVEANSAYPDPGTGKSRELDIYASSGHQILKSDMDFLFTVLLIECVNNTQPAAFFTNEAVLSFLHHQDVKMAGLPVKLHIRGDGEQGWVGLGDFLNMDKYHHYCRGRSATQYCSFNRKKRGQTKWPCAFLRKPDSRQATRFWVSARALWFLCRR